MTITPEQIADGWLPHDGGPCPVRAMSMPGIMWRDGMMKRPGARTANFWGWSHIGGPSDIIAYKPEPTT